jgi:hypothetical protein
MDEGALLPQIAFAIKETQRAFHTLLHNYQDAQGSNSRDLAALDGAIQALGAIVGVLSTIEAGKVQIDLFHWFLCDLIVPSDKGSKISIAQALIRDMRNLTQRLTDLNGEVTAHRTVTSLPGEAMSIRQMVKKYHSIISKIASGQMMYVAPCLNDIY